MLSFEYICTHQRPLSLDITMETITIAAEINGWFVFFLLGQYPGVACIYAVIVLIIERGNPCLWVITFTFSQPLIRLSQRTSNRCHPNLGKTSKQRKKVMYRYTYVQIPANKIPFLATPKNRRPRHMHNNWTFL